MLSPCWALVWCFTCDTLLMSHLLLRALLRTSSYHWNTSWCPFDLESAWLVLKSALCWGYVECMVGSELRVRVGLSTKAQMNTPFWGHVAVMLGPCWPCVGPMLGLCWCMLGSCWFEPWFKSLCWAKLCWACKYWKARYERLGSLSFAFSCAIRLLSHSGTK